MYLLKHLPPHLQKRWTDQLALQHDVDIKRLWRRSPQTMDTVVGNPPLDLNMTFPEEQFSSSSGGSGSGSGSSSSSSSSETSGADCGPQCVTLTASDMDPSDLNGTISLSQDICNGAGTRWVACRDGSPDVIYVLSYVRAERRFYLIAATGVCGGHAITKCTYVSPADVDIDWEGSFEPETCEGGTVSMTSDSGECPSSSSGGASSSSGGSSSGAGSSSDPGSGSGSGSSSDSSSSGGGGGSSGPDASSSSFGSAGFPWSGSASSSGDYDSGRGESYSAGDYTACTTTECAQWTWQGSGWRRILWSYLACPVSCQGDCSERPKQAGYPGLTATVTCDGTIQYRE